jgi:hypothetical protein
MSALVSINAKFLWNSVTQHEIDEECIHKFRRKPQGKRSSAKPGRRCEHSINMDLKEIRCDGVE